MGQKACIRGGKQEEKASCGSKSLYKRRQFGRKNLLKIGKAAQEVVSWDKEPPVGQKACMRGGKQGERTSGGSKSLHGRR